MAHAYYYRLLFTFNDSKFTFNIIHVFNNCTIVVIILLFAVCVWNTSATVASSHRLRSTCLLHNNW